MTIFGGVDVTMKYYARCESRENLHDVLWCKVSTLNTEIR